MGSGIVFEIGSIVIHWYGLLIVVGALVGGYLATREAKRRGEDPGHVWDGLIWCIIPGFVGARLYHVLSSPTHGNSGFRLYVEDPIAIVRVWDGGLGLYGAIVGGVAGLLIYARRHGLRAWRWLDIGAPGLVLAQAIGRWANFINQELYGPPTTLPWGLSIDGEHRIPPFDDLSLYPLGTTHFHPTFLYESLWNLGVFAVLMWAGRRWAHRIQDGDHFLAYLALYGAGRLWMEQFLRPDAWVLGNGLAVATLISGAVALVAAWMLWARHRAPT